MKARRDKRNQRFNRDEVPDLVAKARDEEVSGLFPWIEELSKDEARDELVFRFQNLIETLVRIITTGRDNNGYGASGQFLRLFAGRSVPTQNVATMLHKEVFLHSTKEELMRLGMIACHLAVARTKTNYKGTVLVVFKEEIAGMIKNQNHNLQDSLDYCDVSNKSHEDDTMLKIYLETDLDDHEWAMVQDALEGKKVDFPEELKERLAAYLLPS